MFKLFLSAALLLGLTGLASAQCPNCPCDKTGVCQCPPGTCTCGQVKRSDIQIQVLPRVLPPVYYYPAPYYVPNYQPQPFFGLYVRPYHYHHHHR
jgi:hypothetical protein